MRDTLEPMRHKITGKDHWKDTPNYGHPLRGVFPPTTEIQVPVSLGIDERDLSTTATIRLIDTCCSCRALKSTYNPDDCPVCDGKGWYLTKQGKAIIEMLERVEAGKNRV